MARFLSGGPAIDRPSTGKPVMASPFERWLCLAVLVGVGNYTVAAVTFTGAVFPQFPNQVNEETTLEIGASNLLQPGDDPRATVRVDGDSQLTAARVLLGTSEFAVPSLLVEGPAASVRTGILEGSGNVSVTDGAWLGIGLNGQGLLFGNLGGRTRQPSRLEVTGQGSLVTVSSLLRFGDTGSQMIVRDGGQLRMAIGSSTELQSGARLEVHGDRSQFLFGNQLALGVDGRNLTGSVEVRVSAGGTLLPTTPNSSVVVGKNATVELDGGRFGSSAFGGQATQLEGLFRGDGTIYGNTNVRFSGEMHVGPGQRLSHNGQLELNGLLRIDGGEFDISGQMIGRDTGQIVLSDAVLRFRDGAIISGDYYALSGESDVYGSVQSRSGKRLTVMSDATVNFWDTASFEEVDVEAGGAVRFFGQTRLARGLSLGLAANASESAIISVEDTAQLSGVLRVSAVDSDEYTPGDEFTLIEASRVWSLFSELELPVLEGDRAFLPELTENALSVRVVDTTIELPGDHNDDGIVDAADYTVLRDAGLTDQEFQFAHLVWRENYGSTRLEGSSAVPEPSAVALVILAAAASIRFRRAA